MDQYQLKTYLRWLITIVFSYVQGVIPKDIVPICSNDYDMPV